jgi:hypothetical protein
MDKEQKNMKIAKKSETSLAKYASGHQLDEFDSFGLKVCNFLGIPYWGTNDEASINVLRHNPREGKAFFDLSIEIAKKTQYHPDKELITLKNQAMKHHDFYTAGILGNVFNKEIYAPASES